MAEKRQSEFARICNVNSSVISRKIKNNTLVRNVAGLLDTENPTNARYIAKCRLKANGKVPYSPVTPEDKRPIPPPVDFSRKKQRKHYSGKKKRHTVKTQVVVRKSDGLIVCLAFASGMAHDFRLFKESLTRFLAGAKLLLDSGYQGMGKLHGNCDLPKKKTKKSPLSAEDKRGNRELSGAGARNEHAIGLVKRFRILAERYRNRRRRFSLIAGICNFELAN